MLCQSGQVELKKNTSDDWGNNFAVCASVVKGFYFDKVSDNPFEYKLIKNRLQSVRFICLEIENNNGKITINEDTHFSILEACSLRE